MYPIEKYGWLVDNEDRKIGAIVFYKKSAPLIIYANSGDVYIRYDDVLTFDELKDLCKMIEQIRKEYRDNVVSDRNARMV